MKSNSKKSMDKWAEDRHVDILTSIDIKVKNKRAKEFDGIFGE